MVVAGAVGATLGVSARGDVLELKNGGRIEGTLVNGGDAEPVYILETDTGRVEIARSQVARVDMTSAAEKEYAPLARSAADTVEDHWKLYEWCRDHNLRALSQKHLTRLLELDPDHARARQILGFQKVEGKWQNQEESMASRGMVKFEGMFQTRQHVELLQQQKETKKAQVDWRQDLSRLRRWLTGNDVNRARQAQTEVAAIRDPLATEPLLALLRKESDPALRQLWLEAIARLDDPAAIGALVEHSLFDANDEIRYLCLEHLIASRRPGLIGPYVQKLQSDDNVTINRAAMALGKIGDSEAIGPLIEVLITTHKIKISEGSGMTASSGTGGTGFSMGGGPKFENRKVRNPDVLTALVTLAGITGFEYDQPAWRAWRSEQVKTHRIDLRRDL
jgi:hypothetical protein